MATRLFNVILLQSFDMTSGEVFAGVIPITISPYWNDSVAWRFCIREAFAAYKTQCANQSFVLGREVLPEKVISVVITEMPTAQFAETIEDMPE